MVSPQIANCSLECLGHGGAERPISDAAGQISFISVQSVPLVERFVLTLHAGCYREAFLGDHCQPCRRIGVPAQTTKPHGPQSPEIRSKQDPEPNRTGPLTVDHLPSNTTYVTVGRQILYHQPFYPGPFHVQNGLDSRPVRAALDCRHGNGSPVILPCELGLCTTWDTSGK